MLSWKHRWSAVALAAWLAPAAAFAAEDGAFERTVAPFLRAHCQDCHAGATPKGGVRIDDGIGRDLTKQADRAHWDAIADVLGGHLMPPKKEKQPDAKAVAAVLDWVSSERARALAAVRESSTTLRRLNRDEYRNTLRDLLGVEADVSAFPLDPPAGGFSNNGRALVISPVHLELYADIARAALDRALVEGPRPPVVRWRFDPEAGSNDDHRVKLPDGQNPIVQRGANRREGGFTVMHHADWDRGAHAREFRVPVPGTYVVRVNAAGRVPGRAAVVKAGEAELRRRRDQRDRENPKDEKWHAMDYERGLADYRQDRMYDYGPPRLRLRRTEGAVPEIMAEFDLTGARDGERVAGKTYEFRAHFTGETLNLGVEYAYSVPKTIANFEVQFKDDFPRPEVWLDYLEIEGPIYEAWPPASHTAIVPRAPAKGGGSAEAREALRGFMARAYRRPVTEREVAAKLKVYERARRAGASFIGALKPALVAVLASPHFLYLVEPAGPAKDRRPLDDYQVAARLSYFLWSTMPDAALTAAAQAGKLRTPEGVLAEARRMLRDPRARALADNFASEWLGLREVGSNPPVPDQFPEYDRHLETSIVAEAQGFFSEILSKNLSVVNFLRSDFVMVNERLARFYGIPGVRGDAIRRVPVPAGVARGGILTQASMLSITSNGTRTSPVKRGVWVLKNVLGADPGLPVGNAGDIAPKVPGIDKATVRQRLEKHRELAQCARCHQKIDPLGLALENYDGAGGWREREATGARGRVEDDDRPIDARTVLYEGQKIDGIKDLTAELVRRSDTFRATLASKLFTYALGRELGPADQPVVAGAVSAMKSKEDSLPALVSYIVTSSLFRSK